MYFSHYVQVKVQGLHAIHMLFIIIIMNSKSNNITITVIHTRRMVVASRQAGEIADTAFVYLNTYFVKNSFSKFIAHTTPA